MEGSGDDHEPQNLAFLVAKFGKFQQNMNHTESTLVQHLDEYQETSRRGQAEISETLKKVDENLQNMNKYQSQITDLMMKVTHRGKDPNMYGNKEASGSGGTHEEIRYNLEKAPGSEESLGGGMSHGQMGSRVNPMPYMPVFIDEQLSRHSGSKANPRPYMPTFTDEQGQHEQVEDFVEQLARSTKEYYNLDMRVQIQMPLD
jgi:hypothetical protein